MDAALPAPVARYLAAVLGARPPAMTGARLTQAGTFFMGAGRGSGGWRPFRATQEIHVEPPGFVWEARIRIAPGLDIRVRDSLIDGVGSMRASFLGLFPVVRAQGTPELAAGALQRYLAETVWIPSALLPGDRLSWSALDSSSARAAITVGATTVSLDFHFDEEGLVRRVFTAARFRDVRGKAVPTPWEGRWIRYEERAGIRVPVEGEVAWLTPEGPMPYWRGTIVDLAYSLAHPGPGSENPAP